MDSRQGQGRSRSRARGRAEAPPSPQGQGSSSPELPASPGQRVSPTELRETMAAYSHRYVEPAPRVRGNSDGSNGSGEKKSSSSSSGDSASGRGRGSPGSGSIEQRFTNRGAGRTGFELVNPTNDYVESRPSPDFTKKANVANHKQVTVATNYFSMKTHPKWSMSLYNVKIEPQVDEEFMKRKLVSSIREKVGSYMLTGNQLFATKVIPAENLVSRTSWQNRETGTDTEYTVTLTYLRAVSESEPVIIQFYNVVVRQVQIMMQYKLLGRHYFDPTQKVDFESWRLTLWPGFQNSIRQMESSIMMNVESVWKVLQVDSILVKMTDIKRRSDNEDRYRRACNEAIVGMMVVTKYNAKAYKISRIDFDANPTSTFMRKDTATSYCDYYQERYNITIGDRKQEMLVSEPKARDIRRGQVGDVYLVPELCFPCGLTDELRANFRLMKDLASCLHMQPTERVQTMNRFIHGATQNVEIVKTLKNWGLKVVPQPVEIKARMLQPEDIIMSRGVTIKGDAKADWTMGLRGKQMVSSLKLKNWAIVVTNRDSANIGQLVTTMQKVGTPLGYSISQPEIFKVNDAKGYTQGVTDVITKFKGDIDMVMVVLMNNNADNYANVKKRCSIDYGVPSQCFLAKNISAKGLMSIATKVVIQMNAKQGGEPWGIANPLKSQNLCVLGYDVHHAGAGGGISIGAMTATVTPTLGSYYSCVRQVPAERKEVSTCVARLFENCLNAYKKKNGGFPSRIMMYRDGVGEGQLFAVYDLEIQAFKDCIARLYSDANQELPKLTFIVVNKRISTRFFVKAGVDKFDNPMPGLVVDDEVTRPERYDFFLVSQIARQGCVSPTYYNILLDESNLDPGKLQLFTYKLCHMYFNWSGTVAVPAPCQNAHKLAFLVGTALKRPAKSTLDYLLHFL